MCDTFTSYPGFTPSSDPNTVRIVTGVNDKIYKEPPPPPLTNLSDIWLKSTKAMKKGDIMICGGDFIEPCLHCAFEQDQCDTMAKTLGTTCCKATCGDSCMPDGGGDADPSACQNCICRKDPKNFLYRFYAPNDNALMTEIISAMKRGAYVVFIDDLFYIDDIYQSNRPNHDYVYNTLSQASPNFFWYKIPYKDPANNPTETHMHSKIMSFFYTSAQTPYATIQAGSFNPAYPISITLEMGLVCCASFKNPLIQALGSYIYFISNWVFNRKSSGNMTDAPLKKLASVINTGANYQSVVTTNVDFCGKDFRQENSENRVTFTEKNVTFKLGGDPKGIFGQKFYFGLDLVKSLLGNSKKYCKIGIMNSVVEELPYCAPEKCPPGQFHPFLLQDDVIDVIKRGVSMYIMQKWPSKDDINPDGTFGPYGGLWEWLKSDGNNCINNGWCTKKPSEVGIPGDAINNLSVRWYHGALHWKFYMSESNLLFSTQHPVPLFYSDIKNNTMGYDLLVGNCPNMIAYFDSLFGFYWKYHSIIPDFDKLSPSDLPSAPFVGVTCAPNCYSGGPGLSKIYYCKEGTGCVKTSTGPADFYTLEECQKSCRTPPVNPTPSSSIVSDPKALKSNSRPYVWLPYLIFFVSIGVVILLITLLCKYGKI